MKAVEMYYSIEQVALLVGLSTKTIGVKMHAGEFGRGVVNLGSDAPGGADYRIPASGVNAWLESRRLFSTGEPLPGVSARSIGELRRKVRAGLASEQLQPV
jgi:hypothetical protein